MFFLFSHPVLSYSLPPHGLQHASPLCPSTFPEVCSCSCPLHQWCHPAISSSEALFFCLNLSQHQGFSNESSHYLIASDNQNTGASASALNLPSIQGWFSFRLTGLTSLLSKRLSGVLSSTTVWRHQFFGSAFFTVQFSQLYMTIGKTIALTIQTFVGRVMSLLFNTLSRFVIAQTH